MNFVMFDLKKNTSIVIGKKNGKYTSNLSSCRIFVKKTEGKRSL
jgi:hypothetical protein